MRTEKKTADPSTPLRSGRDDNFVVGDSVLLSRRGPRNCRSLGFARDDKGKGDTLMESGCWTEDVFHHLRWAAGPWP